MNQSEGFLKTAKDKNWLVTWVLIERAKAE
jgi:hypothetical protein